MITSGETNPRYGEYVEKTFTLVDDVTFTYNNKKIIYNDTNGIARIRVYMGNSQLLYDYFDGSTWIEGGSMTPAGPDADRFPQLGDSFIQINQDIFRVVQTGIDRMTLVNGVLDVKNSVIVGIQPSAQPDSAVTLQQLQGIVAGDTTDTITSVDLATRVKCFLQSIDMKVAQREVLAIEKPTVASSVLRLAQDTSNLTIVSNAQQDVLVALEGNEGIGLRLSGQGGTSEFSITSKDGALVLAKSNAELLRLETSGISLSQKGQYTFNTLLSPLQGSDLVDLQSVDSAFIRKTAQSALNMNGFGISNISPGVLSTDAINRGQIPQNQFLYMYTSSDFPVTSQSHVDLAFGESISPAALVPPVPQRVVSDVQGLLFQAGIYKITVHVAVTYSHSTQNPVSLQLVGALSGQVVQSFMQCSNVDSYSRQVHNERSFVLEVTNPQHFVVRIHTLDTLASAIKSGSSVLVETLQ